MTFSLFQGRERPSHSHQASQQRGWLSSSGVLITERSPFQHPGIIQQIFTCLRGSVLREVRWGPRQAPQGLRQKRRTDEDTEQNGLNTATGFEGRPRGWPGGEAASVGVGSGRPRGGGGGDGGNGGCQVLLWTEGAAEAGGPGGRPGWRAEPCAVAATCKGSTQACDVDLALCLSCGPASGVRAACGTRTAPRRTQQAHPKESRVLGK